MRLTDWLGLCFGKGFNDAGYPVIQSRMKGSSRIVEEVKGMYKERAEIEAEYAKRLAKLSRQNIGKDETGSMRAALDVVRTEIEQTSRTHADLSNVFKKDLEGQLAEFHNRVQSQRKNSLANIEKLYKQKTTQESYVNKSRDKYEQDCIRINGYTAQSSLVQGRDLEKVTSKLDKAQSTVNGNDKDYQNFIRALKDTTLKWNAEWKAYLDQCQDLEEERLEFLKSNLWNYANAISAVCVADDQSCERVRVALETCEAPRDIVDFIQRAGTGSAIPDPPEYINYGRGQPPPPRPTYKTANFHRTTTRQPTFVAPVPPSGEAQAGTGPTASASGRRDSLGGGGGLPGVSSEDLHSESRSRVQGDEGLSKRAPPGGVALPGMTESHPSGTSPVRQAGGLPSEDSGAVDAAMRAAKADRRMSAKNFLARTPSRSHSNTGRQGNPMAVQPSNAQSSTSTPQRTLPPSDTAGTTIITPLAEADDDPIAKALSDLRMKPNRSPAPGHGHGPSPPVRTAGTQSYGGISRHPGMVASPSSAGHPSDRPRSPSAAFMQEPERASSPMPVEEVLGQYGQSFPGERRAVSRQNSTASRHSRMSMQQDQRARSPVPADASHASGFAGVGARGRSPSPQPFQKGRPAPTSHQQPQQPQQQRPAAQSRPSQSASAFSVPQRSTTPLGISLDATGSVTHDQMADDFIKRTGSVGPAQGRPFTPQHPSQATGPAAAHGYGQHPAPQPSYTGHHAQQFSTVTSHTVPAPGHQQLPPQQQHYTYGQAPVPQHLPQQPPQGQMGAYQPPPAGAQHGYGHPGAAPQQAPHQQPPRHQDSMGSLGRQSAAPYSGYQSPSPYNQRPASAAAPPGQPAITAAQPSTPGHAYGQAQQQPGQYAGQQPAPPASQYGQAALQETPASAYMHQYQQSFPGQHPANAVAASPAPAPGLNNAASTLPQQPQQQPYGQWNAAQTQPQLPQMNGTSGYASGAPPAHQPSLPPSTQQHQQHGAIVNPQATRPAPSQTPGPPTGQYSDAGKPILFYVKALYDYQAQLDEEFSFTAGDVIAVWETNPDGWWQGELLDDARRRPGSNTFPSNFVSLLN